MSFDWDYANEEHIARHGVTPEEAEDALADPDRKATRSYTVFNGPNSETRAAVIGKTFDGRILVVVITARHLRVRVITARDATDREKRSYRKG